MPTYPCGCQNEMDGATGAMRCVKKCERHLRVNKEESDNPEAYYLKLGALDTDAQQRYVAELEECLGVLPKRSGPDKEALEVGGGASPYMDMLYDAGYVYNAVEPSEWACEYVRGRMGSLPGVVVQSTLDAFETDTEFDLILCAHALEHMFDAPQSLRKMASLLKRWGQLILIIPDDSDMTNPGHLWFFNETTLLRALDQAGFVVDVIQSRRRVPQEEFIYVKARKA